jgi:hypothetical protein
VIDYLQAHRAVETDKCLRDDGVITTPDQIQAIGQAFFTLMAIEQQDPKAWFLMQQIQLRKQRLAFHETRWREALRTKLEYGLDAVAESLKANPQAMELWRQARAMIEKETA